MKIVEKLQI